MAVIVSTAGFLSLLPPPSPLPVQPRQRPATQHGPHLPVKHWDRQTGRQADRQTHHVTASPNRCRCPGLEAPSQPKFFFWGVRRDPCSMDDGRDASGGGARGVPGHPWCILATEQPKTGGETKVHQGRKGEITPQSPKAKCPCRTSVQQDLLTGRGTIRERQGHPSPTLFASLHLCQPNSPQALPFPFMSPKLVQPEDQLLGAQRKLPPRTSGCPERTGRPGVFWGSLVNAKPRPGHLQVNWPEV